MTKPVTPAQCAPKPRTFAQSHAPRVNRLLRSGKRCYETTSYATDTDAEELADVFRKAGWLVDVALLGRTGANNDIAYHRFRFTGSK